MSQAWNMRLLTQHTPPHHLDQSQHPAVLHTHLPDQCTAVYPSVVTRIMTPPQYTWTLPIVPEMQHQNPLTMRNHQMRMRISKQYLWTFCIHENGLSNNVCPYSCPYGANNTTLYIDSLDLSDISDIEDHFLTTSDDDESPALEEVPY